MRGKKYCLLVAKEIIHDDDDDGDGDVVGLVEMGMSLCPVPLDQLDSCAGSGDDGNNTDDNNSDTTTNNDNDHDIGLRPQPTVGVLCVNPTHQNKGIAQALVQKCENVAAEVWSEQFIFVDVEPKNENALSLFRKCGFHCLLDEMGGAQIRNATVSRRRVAESVPHLLLSKRLARTMSTEIIPDATA